METWRIWIVCILLALSFTDLVLTGYYVHRYKTWQSDKPYNLIEMNPLLVFLWSKFGFALGHFIGSVIILSLIYIISKEAHWIVVSLLGAFLLFAMYNHFNNITLLHKLIEQYPSGYLPEKIFGIVEGNNPK